MDEKDVNRLQSNTVVQTSEILRFGTALLFVVAIMLFTLVRGDQLGTGSSLFVVIAAMVGAYMAMNIGANDVANNVGPVVGSGAITLGGAILIAAIFEAAGAIIAGGAVASTIRGGIIDPDLIPDPQTFMWLMLAALLAAALWINVATASGAPVSTTHSIVGAVLGAGVASSGFGVANWDVLGRIAASWVISPLMGGAIAAGLLYFIKRRITYQADLVKAALYWVPVLLGAMGFAAVTYLVTKGLGRLVQLGPLEAYGAGLMAGVLTYVLVKLLLNRHRDRIENSKRGVNSLFTIPLIFAAAMLSFAHGSNDVANAVGPLSAIVEVARTGGEEIALQAPIPLWVLVIGGLGLSVGLWLYGPKIIRTVGTEITEIDRMRAYCIAMAATVTVIIASQLGLPVSTTHVTVGAVFGVGFLREFLKSSYDRKLREIYEHHQGENQAEIDAFIRRFQKASVRQKGEMLRELKRSSKELALAGGPELFTKKDRKSLKSVYRKQLVKRSMVLRIVAAWVITVPASALMGALLFFMIRGMLS